MAKILPVWFTQRRREGKGDAEGSARLVVVDDPSNAVLHGCPGKIEEQPYGLMDQAEIGQ
jgi:hypothetical protein